MIGIVASGPGVVIHAGGSCHGCDAIKPLGEAERLLLGMPVKDVPEYRRLLRERDE